MIKETQSILKKILLLIGELEQYSRYKEDFTARLKSITKKYQNKECNYFEYEKNLKDILKGKSVKEWAGYYNSQISFLLREIEYNNSKLYQTVYSDQSYAQLKVHKPSVIESSMAFAADRIDDVKEAGHTARLNLRALRRKGAKRLEGEVTDLRNLLKIKLNKLARVSARDAEAIKERLEKIGRFGKRVSIKEIEAIKQAIKTVGSFSAKEARAAERPFLNLGNWIESKIRRAKLFRKKEAEKIKEDINRIEHLIRLKTGRLERAIAREEEVIAGPFVRLGRWFKRLFKFKRAKKIPAPIPIPAALPGVKKQPLFARIKAFFAARKKAPVFEKVIAEKEVIQLKPLKKPILTRIKESLSLLFVRKGEVISGKTEIGRSLLDLERLREKELKTATAKLIRPRILAEEAERVAAILKKREKITLYRPSTIGAVANLTVRRFSLFFINTFPVFFEQLYRNLRLANIRILSNTYVNIMFFFSILSLLGGFVLFSLFFASFVKGIAAGLITAVFIFTMFYYYPVSETRTRIRSIKTNIPFAINHMSAVINSGVIPHEMFKLIADSKEYGEVVIESEKIVEFIDLFGYDLTTAIETVAATTPEKTFKDFLDGMVTTISSGGDIKQYLKEKAEGAMNAYELERQKYVETISTYSDIYTGILIAAPLFFIATLTLVSILGGTIAGMPVESVVAIGTYFVIPLLNVAFIMLLEFTQPTV